MVVLIVLAAAVAVLAVVLVANAARLKPTPVPDPLPPSEQPTRAEAPKTRDVTKQPSFLKMDFMNFPP